MYTLILTSVFVIFLSYLDCKGILKKGNLDSSDRKSALY